MNELDLIIIVAGPAGMSAALFAQGDELKFSLIEEGKPCGFVERVINTNFTNLENYLGIYGVDGTEVQRIFAKHLESRKIPIESARVNELMDEGNTLTLRTDAGNMASKTVILATGTRPKKIIVPGIKDVMSRVYYSVDEETFKSYNGREILVVGGRNSGVVTAIRLKEWGCKPIVIEKSSVSTAKNRYIERLRELKIPYLFSSELERITEEGALLAAHIRVGDSRRLFNPAAIVGCIGYVPNNELALLLGLSVDKDGYVIVNREMQTSNERVFAAGDLNGGVKMIAVAVGEGATAEYYVNSLVRSKWKRE